MALSSAVRLPSGSLGNLRERVCIDTNVGNGSCVCIVVGSTGCMFSSMCGRMLRDVILLCREYIFIMSASSSDRSGLRVLSIRLRKPTLEITSAIMPLSSEAKALCTRGNPRLAMTCAIVALSSNAKALCTCGKPRLQITCSIIPLSLEASALCTRTRGKLRLDITCSIMSLSFEARALCTRGKRRLQIVCCIMPLSSEAQT